MERVLRDTKSGETKKCKVSGSSSKVHRVFPDNPSQNNWHKLMKLSKIGFSKENLIVDMFQVYRVVAGFLFLEAKQQLISDFPKIC